MLQRGGRVPHFDVRTIDGARVRYRDVWQARNLLLLSLAAPAGEFADYLAGVQARLADISDQQTTFVATTEEVAGVPRPGVLIADRWGEIYSVVPAEHPSDLPPVDDLLEWLRYIQHACPECEGETR